MRQYDDYSRTCKEFKAIFGLDFRKYVDRFFYRFGAVCVDIVKFGDWLKATFYNGDMGNISIKEAVEAQFGERGLTLIEELMLE